MRAAFAWKESVRGVRRAFGLDLKLLRSREAAPFGPTDLSYPIGDRPSRKTDRGSGLAPDCPDDGSESRARRAD